MKKRTRFSQPSPIFQRPLHASNGFSSAQYIQGEYIFPSKDECMTKPLPKRDIKIPVTFDTVTTYKQTFTKAIKEHLNVLLYHCAVQFHTSLSSLDVSTLASISENVDSCKDLPLCAHGPTTLRAVRKEGKNTGRLFYTCAKGAGEKCNFFAWADEVGSSSSQMKIDAKSNGSKKVIADHNSLSVYLNSRNVQLYGGVKLTRKTPFLASKNSKSNRFKRKQDDVTQKKSLYLVLPSKKTSSCYGKDDLWVVSKSLDFDFKSTFIAKSVFYGPNSAAELEILPLSGYSASNWPNNSLCYAIQSWNASTELTCISNLVSYTNPLDVPIIPHLLMNSSGSSHRLMNNRFDLHCLLIEEVAGLMESVIESFTLNDDQATALKQVTEMFLKNQNNVVTLIHGVFGAGKSYLLATLVLFLVQLFEVIEARFDVKTKLKVLISSTTNVAVDRVLQSLLEFGFENFVRVGSLKKIAKPILPYSIHASENDDHELKELNDILKSELTNQEKGMLSFSGFFFCLLFSLLFFVDSKQFMFLILLK